MMQTCVGFHNVKLTFIFNFQDADADLLAAVLRGDQAAVESLLQEDRNPNMYTTADEPILLVALKHGHDDIIKVLLSYGADPDQYDSHGKTLLHYISCTNKHELLQHLITVDSNVNARDSDNKTPLHYAAAVNQVTNACILMKYGADPESMDVHWMSPLLTAAKHGAFEMCELLLRRVEVDISHRDTNDLTALHHACRGGYVQVAQTLVNNGCQFGETASGETEVMLAVEAGSVHLVRLLLDYGVELDHVNRKRMSALHYAAKLNNYECARLLCNKGAQLDLQDRKGLTPLMIAAKHGHDHLVNLFIDNGALVNIQDNTQLSALHLSAIHGHMDCVTSLLKVRARLDLQGQNGNLPVMLSAHNGHLDILRILVTASREHKYWNVNIGNLDQMTALHMAADKGHLDCVQFLLQEGSDPGRPNRNGDTPLMLAAKRGHYSIVKLLVRYTTSDPNGCLNQFNLMRKSALHVATKAGSTKCVDILLTAGAIPDVRDSHGKTPLIVAAEHGFDDIVDMLIKSKADINSKTEDGWSALHMACQNNHPNIVRILLAAGVDPEVTVWMNDVTPCLIASSRGNYSIVKMLLRKGANVNRAEFNGMTALHKAARGGHAQCVKLLLSNGANVDPTSSNGETPAQLTIKESHRKVLRLLLEANCSVSNLNPFLAKPNKKFVTILEMCIIGGCLLNRRFLEEGSTNSTLPRPLAEDSALLTRVWSYVMNPRSLQQLARCTIRKSLGYGIQTKVDKLPLPSYLKDFVFLRELKNLSEMAP